MNEHTDARGELVFEQACRMGLEGIVSKRWSAPYRCGPPWDWLKEPGQPRDDLGTRAFHGYVHSPNEKGPAEVAGPVAEFSHEEPRQN
jgi:hypothetical protein